MNRKSSSRVCTSSFFRFPKSMDRVYVPRVAILWSKLHAECWRKNGEERREGRTRAIKMERRRVGKWAGWQIVTRAGLRVSRWTGRSQGKGDTSLLCEKSVILAVCDWNNRESGLRWPRTSYRGDVNAIPVSAVPGPDARFRHRAPSRSLPSRK